MNYDRKRKEDRPVLAICYDFDKTLSPDDMQAQGYIQSVGYDVQKFWDESNDLAKANDMDNNLAYMWKMVQESEGRMVFNKEKLAEYGARVKLFDGVEDWFERIRAYGKTRNVIVEHYIISSGLKEMIEGTKMARAGAFEKYTPVPSTSMTAAWQNGLRRSSTTQARPSSCSGSKRGSWTSTIPA